MINNEILIIIGGGFLVGVAIVSFLYHKEKFLSQNQIERKIPRKIKTPTNFIIYNYFPKHSISIEVDEPRESSDKPIRTRLVNSILPKKTGGLTKIQVRDHLKGGNIIKIFVISPTGERRHFSDYVIDVSNEERIKGLHVGMITTRFIGSTDGLRMATTSGNSISGNATLKIHNLSYIPLNLNGGAGGDPTSGGGVSVRPHSTDRYMGYLHQGVTLGTIFSDDEGLYPDFQYLEPHSDLYYGVVSDIRQPLSGCWQLEFNDVCDYGQSMWPFQEGIL